MPGNTRTNRLAVSLARQAAYNPVPRSLLMTLANEPATEQLAREALVTRAARTVLARDIDRAKIALQRSELREGLFELPSGLELLPGLPGRSGERLPLGSGERKEATREVGTAERADGFIPATEAVIYNPLPAFASGGKPFVSRRERALRRRLVRASAASDNHVTIFGGDDRINIYPSGYPERCVCRIEVYTQEYNDGPWIFRKRGTGFIAGERIMMTSGHMRPDQPYAGWMIKVVPGYYDGSSVYGAGFYTFASDYRYWDSDTGNDMMVCRLYDPIGATTGYFGAITYQSRWEDWNVWSMCGYPYDRGESRPTYQGGIPVRDDDDGDDIRLPDGGEWDTAQIENEADEASGASGSPLYSWFDNGQLYAIGVHHGTETDYIFPFSSETLSAAAGGPGLPAIINWARANWP